MEIAFIPFLHIDLGEEYRYVLERKFQEVFPGNTLTRPSLLLQPWAVQSTSTATKTAQAGSSYADKAKNYSRNARGGFGLNLPPPKHWF